MVQVVAVVNSGLGNSSHLVDLGDGRAPVVDASRDLRAVDAAAERCVLRLIAAADTQLHADFSPAQPGWPYRRRPPAAGRTTGPRSVRLTAPAGHPPRRHPGVADARRRLRPLGVAGSALKSACQRRLRSAIARSQTWEGSSGSPRQAGWSSPDGSAATGLDGHSRTGLGREPGFGLEPRPADQGRRSGVISSTSWYWRPAVQRLVVGRGRPGARRADRGRIDAVGCRGDRPQADPAGRSRAVWPVPGTTAAEAGLPLADPSSCSWDVARAPVPTSTRPSPRCGRC